MYTSKHMRKPLAQDVSSNNVMDAKVTVRENTPPQNKSGLPCTRRSKRKLYHN